MTLTDMIREKQEREKRRLESIKRLTETKFYKTILKRDQKLKSKNREGRPYSITAETLIKLFESFMIGCNDEIACFNANVSIRSLYDFQQKFPEFLQVKDAWKLNPLLKAQNTLYQNLNDPDNAKWLLERHPKTKADNSKAPESIINNNTLGVPNNEVEANALFKMFDILKQNAGTKTNTSTGSSKKTIAKPNNTD